MKFLGKENKDRPLFIAEIGALFPTLQALLLTIELAKDVGADFAKIQYYTAEDLVPDNGFEWEDKNLFKMYKDSEFPKQWLLEALSFGSRIGMPVFSSVYSLRGLKDLEQLACPAYKISSFENENKELLEAVYETNKPFIVSTGMLSDDRLDTVWAEALPDVLMHCVSKYPCPIKEANLARIDELKDRSGAVGYSDHVHGFQAAVIASAIGVDIIEKHFSIHPDNLYTLDLLSFRAMINACTDVSEAINGSNTNTELHAIKEQRMIGKERI